MSRTRKDILDEISRLQKLPKNYKNFKSALSELKEIDRESVVPRIPEFTEQYSIDPMMAYFQMKLLFGSFNDRFFQMLRHSGF